MPQSQLRVELPRQTHAEAGAFSADAQIPEQQVLGGVDVDALRAVAALDHLPAPIHVPHSGLGPAELKKTDLK